MPRSFRDHTASVARTFSDSRIEEATTQSPARRCEAKPPATPKLIMRAIALPDGAVGDLFQFAPGGAAHHLHAGGGGNSRLESQADKCDDETAVRFNRRVDDPEGVVCVSYQSIYESTPGKIQLGCH